MFNKAVRQFKIIKKNSYFIGDKDTDAKAAKKFNIKYFNVDNKTNLYNLVKKYITRK
jgi:histidinol phosphatase-like enzyme